MSHFKIRISQCWRSGNSLLPMWCLNFSPIIPPLVLTPVDKHLKWERILCIVKTVDFIFLKLYFLFLYWLKWMHCTIVLCLHLYYTTGPLLNSFYNVGKQLLYCSTGLLIAGLLMLSFLTFSTLHSLVSIYYLDYSLSHQCVYNPEDKPPKTLRWSL